MPVFSQLTQITDIVNQLLRILSTVKNPVNPFLCFCSLPVVVYLQDGRETQFGLTESLDDATT